MTITTVDEKVGQRILERRRELGLSQRDISPEGTSTGYVSLIESGKRRPTWEIVAAIATTLRDDPHRLATGHADPERQHVQRLEELLGEIAFAVSDLRLDDKQAGQKIDELLRGACSHDEYGTPTDALSALIDARRDEAQAFTSGDDERQPAEATS